MIHDQPQLLKRGFANQHLPAQIHLDAFGMSNCLGWFPFYINRIKKKCQSTKHLTQERFSSRADHPLSPSKRPCYLPYIKEICPDFRVKHQCSQWEFGVCWKSGFEKKKDILGEWWICKKETTNLGGDFKYIAFSPEEWGIRNTSSFVQLGGSRFQHHFEKIPQLCICIYIYTVPRFFLNAPGTCEGVLLFRIMDHAESINCFGVCCFLTPRPGTKEWKEIWHLSTYKTWDICPQQWLTSSDTKRGPPVSCETEVDYPPWT